MIWPSEWHGETDELANIIPIWISPIFESQDNRKDGKILFVQGWKKIERNNPTGLSTINMLSLQEGYL